MRWWEMCAAGHWQQCAPRMNDIGDDQFNIEPYYITKLKEMQETEEFTLEVDCNHIYEFKKSLYKQLEDYPADVIPIFDLVAL